jgi:hypothetical protein
MKYTFDAVNVYLGTIKVLYNGRRLTKHCCMVEKSKNRRRFRLMCRFQHIMCRQLSQCEVTNVFNFGETQFCFPGIDSHVLIEQALKKLWIECRSRMFYRPGR